MLAMFVERRSIFDIFLMRSCDARSSAASWQSRRSSVATPSTSTSSYARRLVEWSIVVVRFVIVIVIVLSMQECVLQKLNSDTDARGAAFLLRFLMSSLYFSILASYVCIAVGAAAARCNF